MSFRTYITALHLALPFSLARKGRAALYSISLNTPKALVFVCIDRYILLFCQILIAMAKKREIPQLYLGVVDLEQRLVTL